jgi:hypothetical protein
MISQLQEQRTAFAQLLQNIANDEADDGKEYEGMK